MLIFLLISSLSLADSLYLHNDFYDAATEYERFLFYNPSDSQADYARFKLSLAYGRSGEPTKAEDILKELIDHSPAWSKLSQATLTKLYINEENYPLARLELNDRLLLSPAGTEKNELYQLAGFLDLIEENPAGATENFAHTGADSLRAAAESLIRLPRKNPALSALLSTIIPGTGEIYCGRYRLGVSALLVNALTVGGIVYTVANKKYVDAVLIFSFLFPRFYSGSQRNARDFAEDYNEAAYRRRLTEILKTYRFDSQIDR